MTNVLRTEPALRESGFSRVDSDPRHRCDLVAIGFSLEAGQRHYDYDNRSRANGCLFQYTFAGEGRFQLLPGGREIVLRPGTGILVPFPSNTRYWLAPGTAWEFCYIIIDGEMAYALVDRLLRQSGYLWTMPRTHPAIDLIRGVQRQMLEDRIPDVFECSAMAYQFLMELFRLQGHTEQALSPAVRRAIDLVELRYADTKLSVDMMAAAAGYSRYHFSRVFKHETRASPSTYLQRFRIRRALQLLTASDLPIKRIAIETGFSDSAYFCKEFKRWTQKTPMAVRRFGSPLNLDTVHIR